MRTPLSGEGSTNDEYLPPPEKMAWVIGRCEILAIGLPYTVHEGRALLYEVQLARAQLRLRLLCRVTSRVA